jgi:probable HAF family extracellular repeat protein
VTACATADRAMALAHGRLVMRANFSAAACWGRLMSYWKSFGLGIFAGVCLLSETTGSAQAQCTTCAVEFSGKGSTNLGSLPASEYLPAFQYSIALSINNTGQAVGYSTLNIGSGGPFATEWSGGKIIDLGLGAAYGINNAGQAVGYSPIEDPHATEWSGGNAINLGGCRDSSLALRTESTVPVRRWDTAMLASRTAPSSITPRSGAAATLST